MINVYAQTTADGLSQQERDLYDLIMAYRADFGLPSIPISVSLTATAGRHAMDTLYNIWEPGVSLPSGANLHSWSDAFYYEDHSQPQVMWYAPQRLGIDYASEGYEISAAGFANVAGALEGWKSSPGHNDVIINQGVWTSLTWNAIGIGVEQDSSVGTYGGKIYHVWFGTLTDPNSFGSSGIALSDILNGDTASVFDALRDYDGNNLGSPEGWKALGSIDVQGDGDVEYVYVNPLIGRWATLGPDSLDFVDFSNHGQGGDTRVVGIYIDPLVELGIVVKNSDHDSQRRFQNDLEIDNFAGVLGAGDYDGDGLQEVYLSLQDGSAYLHAYMHADGNIRYANYQSADQVADFMQSNGVSASVYEDWLA